MKNKIPFVKMHGLGNDFVIICRQDLPVISNMQDFAGKISQRNTGIGCDQFIIYDRKEDHILMSIYNHDGSKAKACGNASRCLSRLMFDLHGDREILLDVDGRKVKCEYITAEQIKVNMGEVSFEEKWMPDEQKLWSLAQRYGIEPKEAICADIGNPHLVIFSKLTHQDQKIIGNNLQDSELFPDGVNVNFAQVNDDRITLKVWERGTGFTYACGSGACVTFAAADKLGFVEKQGEIIFKLGTLKMSNEDDNIIMCGSSDYVFSGEYCHE